MPEFHSEPYLYLPAVSHKSALIAWGAFYFRTNSRGQWKIVDDDDLKYVHPPRKDSIGAQSAPYGPARVEVYDRPAPWSRVAKTEVAITAGSPACTPDTEYTYKVFVKGQEWAAGERWDWSATDKALVQSAGVYDNRFRTNPDAQRPAASLAFAVIGDFGVGVRQDIAGRAASNRSPRLAPHRRDRRCAIHAHDRRQYLRRASASSASPIGGTGDEDDDWFFTYFQPYRYVINRIPVYPSIGNHDADETEERDDRAQVEDNFYLRERIKSEEAAGRASFGPGLVLPIQLRIGYRVRLHRHVERRLSSAATGCSSFRSIGSSSSSRFRPKAPHPTWRIPFAHHPLYSAGPQHHNTRGMRSCCRCSSVPACA